MCTISPRPNRRGRGHPVCAIYEKKSPYFRTSSSLNMAVRGGLTRFARPAGSPLTAFTVCPTGCRQLSTPGRGFSSPPRSLRSRSVQLAVASCRPPVGASHPPGVCNTRKKSPYFRTSSSLNMAVRGGLTRFARPAGSPLTAFTVCPTGCRQLSTPGRGFSSPPVCAIYEKKARTFVRAFF